MKHPFILFLICLFFQELDAQFNDSTFYLVRYSTTGIINRTNDASSYAITNGLRFGVSKKTVVVNSTSSWVYGQQQKRLTNNDISTALDFNLYRKNKRFYYWGLANYESSYSLKVNNRTQTGLGVAYSPVDRKDLYVNISEGILYEFASLKVSDSTNDVYSTFRNSFRFRLRYDFNDRIRFEGVTFLQNSLRQSSDYIVNGNATLSIKLMQWVSLTSSVRYNKVNRNNRENMLFTFGVTAEKYF